MGSERGGEWTCGDSQGREDRDAKNYSNQGVTEKIKHQVVTSFYESNLLAGSFSSFLT